LKLVAIAGLVTCASESSAMARHVRPTAQQTAYTQLLRSLRQQQRISLVSVKQSAISQLQGLNFARNHGLISRSTYSAYRADLISNYHIALGEMRGLIGNENASLAALHVQAVTGQISIAQFQAQASNVISVSHAEQLALIAKVQQGLYPPATPF
jgi:hypothetical protein